jgi:hypothetical protein
MPADHTIFLVHGMGKPDDAMFEAWERSLARHYAAYAPQGDSFSQQFTCIRINYDHLFEERRKAWADQVKLIMDSAAELPVEAPTKEDLESMTEDSFATTHLMDVLLYRFSPLVAEQVRSFVNEKILDEARKGGRFSIIAHSLGTAIVHDAVNALYQTRAGGAPLLTPEDFRFHAVVQLANVSRTLETKWDAYASYLRPGVGGSSDGNYAATRMLSASHRWDPLVALRSFQPVDNWPDAETVARARFAHLRPGIIQHWNVHAFSHYLDDPRVHIPMFRLLGTKDFVSQSKEREVLKTFDEDNPISKFDAYCKELKVLLTGEADFSWKRVAKVFKGYAKIVKELAGE